MTTILLSIVVVLVAIAPATAHAATTPPDGSGIVYLTWVGNDDEPGDPSPQPYFPYGPGTSIFSSLAFTPTCATGPCDIIVTRLPGNATTTLHYDGTSTTGTWDEDAGQPTTDCSSTIVPQDNYLYTFNFAAQPGANGGSALSGTVDLVSYSVYLGGNPDFATCTLHDPHVYRRVTHWTVSGDIFPDIAPSRTTIAAAPPPVPTVTAPSPPSASTALVALSRRVPELLVRTPAPSDVWSDAARLAVNVLLAIALVVFMPFPAHLFNSTLDQNEDRIRNWWRTKLGLRPRDHPRTNPTGFAIVLLAGAVLGALLNPGFGANRGTVEQLVGSLVAVAVVTTVTIRATLWILHRDVPSPLEITLHAFPAALVVAALCVAMSRAVGFEPGYLYGVLAGVSVAATLTRTQEGRSAATATIALATVSIVAWIAWSVFRDRVAGDPSPPFVTAIGLTALAGVFVAGIESMFIGLLPLRFLSGHKIITWNRRLWSILFGVGAFVFIDAILNPGHGYGPTNPSASIATALILFVGFGVFSVLFWDYFRRRPTVPSSAPTD